MARQSKKAETGAGGGRKDTAAVAADAAPLRYQSGFGNHFATEALPGALPVGRNSPQRCAYGLYAEQYSGTAFTAPRHANRRSWLYRIRPAAVHERFVALDSGRLAGRFDEVAPSPNQLRWDPLPVPRAATDFLGGLVSIAGTGSPEQQTGCGIHWYVANRSMHGRFFCDADGELLIVPQLGALRFATDETDGAAVSLDLDFIDPSDAPGVGTPVRGGVTYREAHLAMEMIADSESMISLEVVEINPVIDLHNKTALLGVEMVLSSTGKKIL